MRVALKTSLVFSCRLQGEAGSEGSLGERGEGEEGHVRSGAEEEDHAARPESVGNREHQGRTLGAECCSVHQGVREADFGTVDGAVARGLDDGEEVCISRIEHDVIQRLLYFPRISVCSLLPKSALACVCSHKAHSLSPSRGFMCASADTLITVSCQLLALDRNRINPTGCWS